MATVKNYFFLKFKNIVHMYCHKLWGSQRNRYWLFSILYLPYNDVRNQKFLWNKFNKKFDLIVDHIDTPERTSVCKNVLLFPPSSFCHDSDLYRDICLFYVVFKPKILNIPQNNHKNIKFLSEKYWSVKTSLKEIRIANCSFLPYCNTLTVVN